MVSLSRQLALASVTGLALICLCSPVWATDGTVRNLRFDPANRHFVIDATGPVKAMVNTLNIAGHKRVIIDLDNAEIGVDLPRDVQLLQSLTQQLPSVRNVTVNQYGGNGRPIVRILLDLQGDPGTIRLVRNQGPQIELQINETTAGHTTPTPGYSSPNLANRRPDLPPSLSSLRPDDTRLSTRSNEDSVSRDVYNRSLSTQEEQKRQIESLQRELAQLNQQMQRNSASSQNMDDLKRSLGQLNQKYETLLQDNQHLKAQLSTQNHQVGNAELARLKAENQSLQTRLQQVTASIQSQGPGVEEMKRALSNMNQQYEHLTQENRSLKNQLAAKGQSDFSLSQKQQSEIERLKSENRTLQSRIEQLSLTGVKTSEANELRRSLSAIQSQLDNLTREKEQLNQENLRLKNQLAERPSSTTSSTSASQVDLQKLRGQLTIAQQSLNDSIRTINEQNKEIAYLRNQVADVKAGLDASSREQIARLQTSLDEKDETIRDLQRQLVTKLSSGQGGAANQADLAMLKRQLDKTSQQHQEDLRNLNEQLRQKNAQLQALQTEAGLLSDLRRENNELKNQLAHANQKITEGHTSRVSASELQSRDSRIAELQRQLTSTQSELSNLKNSKDSTTKASTSLKEAMDRLTRENRELHNTVDSLKLAQQQSSGSGDQVRQLQNKLASLQDDLSEMTEKYNQSVQEANKAKQDLIFYQRSNTKTAFNPDLENKVADLNRELAQLKKENASLRDSAVSKSSKPYTLTNMEA
jgi:chromosome segregation ATPase